MFGEPGLILWMIRLIVEQHGGVSVVLLPVEHASHARDLGPKPCEAAVPVLKKSQTAVSPTERYFTLSVVCHIVECTRRQRKGNKKKHSDRFRPAWQEMERKVCPTITTT